MSTDRQSLEKHMTGKEVLRAIADGADPMDFEWRDEMVAKEWRHFHPQWWGLEDLTCTHAEFRIKPRTRVVNGFTVPAPIQEMPKKGTQYFIAVCHYEHWHTPSRWEDGEADKRWFSRGILFSTKEAAIANAKAMVGVDPEAT